MRLPQTHHERKRLQRLKWCNPGLKGHCAMCRLVLYRTEARAVTHEGSGVALFAVACVALTFGLPPPLALLSRRWAVRLNVSASSRPIIAFELFAKFSSNDRCCVEETICLYPGNFRLLGLAIFPRRVNQSGTPSVGKKLLPIYGRNCSQFMDVNVSFRPSASS